MQLRIEFLRAAVLSCCARIKPLQSVPAERIHENIFGHFQALVKFLKVLVGLCLVGAELLGGNNGQGAVKIVNGFKEISSETLDRECTSILNISLGSFLEIPEVCDRAKIFVLVDGKY
jgi:hypothetical protein